MPVLWLRCVLEQFGLLGRCESLEADSVPLLRSGNRSLPILEGTRRAEMACGQPLFDRRADVRFICSGA